MYTNLSKRIINIWRELGRKKEQRGKKIQNHGYSWGQDETQRLHLVLPWEKPEPDGFKSNIMVHGTHDRIGTSKTLNNLVPQLSNENTKKADKASRAAVDVALHWISV